MYTLRRCLALPLAAFLICLGLAARAEAGSLPYGQGLLWKVTAANGQVSHVLGTFHTSDPRVLALPAPIADAFRASRHLAVEVVSTPELEAAMQDASFLEGDRSLDRILGPKLFRRVTIAGRMYGLHPENLKGFKPWALMALFELPLEEIIRSAQGVAVLDDQLQRMAREQGKTVQGLETLEEQLTVFDKVGEPAQIALLEAVVMQHDNVRAIFDKFVGAYLARDVQAIHDLAMEQMPGVDPKLIQSFMTHLVDRRNVNMALRSRPLLDKGKAFIAVGALHLPGEKGVLRLLEQQGYKIARVY